MDQKLNVERGEDRLPQSPAPQATVVPMGETWAAGVDALTVSPRSRPLRRLRPQVADHQHCAEELDRVSRD